MSHQQKLKDIAQVLREAASPVASVLRNKPPVPNPLDQRMLRAAEQLERDAYVASAGTIHYRDLLIRYICHVRYCDGADFITIGTHHEQESFSADEWAELVALSQYQAERIVADDGTATVVIRQK